VNVAAVQSEALATASLARHLLEQVLAKRQVGKGVDNLAFSDLQTHHLPAAAPVKCKAEERERKVLLPVNLAGSPEAECLLRLSRGRASRSAERKRQQRGLHRRGHNKFC